jgi:hypothetical protein
MALLALWWAGSEADSLCPFDGASVEVELCPSVESALSLCPFDGVSVEVELCPLAESALEVGCSGVGCSELVLACVVPVDP